MEFIATNIELLYEKAKKYSETSIELFKLNAVDKIADLVATLFIRFILIMVVAVFSLFISITLSLYIGKLFNESYIGFLIVSAFYLFLILFLFIKKDKIFKKSLTNLVIEKLLKAKESSITDLSKKDENQNKL